MIGRRIAATLAIATGAAALTSGVATGGEWAADRGTERVATKITINDSCSFACRAARRNYTVEFFGNVKSDAPECERRRKVGLYRRASSGSGYDLIEKTESDGEGRWQITRTDKPGFTNYRVKTKEARKGNTICLRATSAKESHGPS